MTRTEHLLTILAEECAETAQRASKALRFGINEIEPGQLLTNADRIMYEYAHIVEMIHMLQYERTDRSVLPDVNLKVWRLEKRAKVVKFLDYSRECGTLED